MCVCCSAQAEYHLLLGLRRMLLLLLTCHCVTDTDMVTPKTEGRTREVYVKLHGTK